MEEKTNGNERGFIEWIAKRARKRGVGFWVSFGIVLLTLALLAHIRGIGYELGLCVVPEYREVVLNWIFWWPFHAVGAGSTCGGVSLFAFPFYIASVMWWVLFSFVIARVAMYILPKLRGIE